MATVKRGAEGQPERFIISPVDGSAYYLSDGVLAQAPLDPSGQPLFTDSGVVNWTRGFDSDEDRARVKSYRDLLLQESS